MDEDKDHTYIKGKKVGLFESGQKCTMDEFIAYINRFSPFLILTILAHLASKKQYSENIDFIFLGIPIINYPLEYLAKYTIMFCSTETKREITETELAEALRMAYYLIEKDLPAKPEEEILMKLAYNQFPYNENFLNLFARHIYIYLHLWGKNTKINDINILEDIKDEISISYELVLLFTHLFFGIGRQNNGYFWLYDENQINVLKDQYKHLKIDSYSQEKFIAWISGDYEKIKKEKLIQNPFAMYPIIDTNVKPLSNKEEVFLLISPPLLVQRVTRGMFHLLSKKYKEEGGNNKFRDHFGFVFEDYVGFLLKNTFREWRVFPEIIYNNQQNKTVDWIVTKDDKAILIEVKHPTLNLESKELCDLSKINENLNSTIYKGVRQLKATINNICSKQYNELTDLNLINQFEKVIVVYDPIYFENTVIMDLIKKTTTEEKVTIINISDFEDFLSLQKHKEDMFDVLKNKNKTEDYQNIDMKDYLEKIYPGSKLENTLLKEIYEEFFSKIKHSEGL